MRHSGLSGCMVSAPPPRVPLEILLHIASFIDEEDLPNLFGVNKFFFELALDARYKEVTLGPWLSAQKQEQIPRYLKHLCRRHIAPRVQTIRLMLHSTLLRDGSSENRWSLLKQKILDRVRFVRGQDLNLGAARGVNRGAVKLFSTLNSVDTLVINEYLKSNRSLPPVISLVWVKLGSTLRHLDIHARQEKVADMLSPAPQLPRLESFSLTLKREAYYLPLLRVSSLQVLSHFLRMNSASLESVKISSPLQCFLMTSGILLRGVGRMKNLHTLYFNARYDDHLHHLADTQSLDGLVEFLRDNPSLEHLSIPPIPSNIIALRSSAEHGIPWLPTYLKSFTLLATNPAAPTHAIISTAQAIAEHSCGTLDAISLQGDPLPLAASKTFLTSISAELSDRLRYLAIGLLSLNPAVLDLLATRLPQLNHLQVYFARVLPKGVREPASRMGRFTDVWEDFTDIHLRRFEEEMKQRQYSDWSLSSIRIISGHTNERRMLLKVSGVLQRSIPGVRGIEIR